jgi:hypothetical protein
LSLGPSAGNGLRAGFVRNIAVGGNEAQSQGPLLAGIGISNAFDDRGVSAIYPQGYSSFGRSHGDAGNRDNTWVLGDGFNYARANHSLKLGASLRYRRGWSRSV